jgi:phosphoesterase RecJ-like protein
LDPARLAELDRLVDAHDAFVHVTHVNPDADGLGSALAVSRWLTRSGKDSRVALPAPLPQRLAFLVRPGEVEVVSDPGAQLPADPCWMLYDVASLERLGSLGPAVRDGRGPVVVLDHHDADAELAATCFVEPEAGATAQVVFDLLVGRGVTIDLDLALPLYVGLVADTGSFNYGKTTPHTHEVAASLLRAGVDPLWVHGELEGRRPLDAVRVAGKVMAELAVDPRDPRLAHATVGHELFRSVGADALESVDLVNHTVALDGVRAGVLLVEAEPAATRLSFRSKGATSIVEVARSFGGGGHRNAAGATVPGRADAVREEVLGRLREALAAQHGPPEQG